MLKHEMDLYFSQSAAFEVTAQDCAHTCAAINQSALTSHSRVISHMALTAQLIGSKNSKKSKDFKSSAARKFCANRATAIEMNRSSTTPSSEPSTRFK